jgi:excisionase family DNA binding protein
MTEPEILTIDDLAKLLRCKRRAIYSLTRARAHANRLPVLRLGIGLRFRRVDVDPWLAASAGQTEGGQ